MDGVLLIERLDPDQRKEAMRTLRQMTFDPSLVNGHNGNGSSGRDAGQNAEGTEGLPRL